MDAVTLNPTRLALAAVIGLIILLVLIIRFHVHAMISILVGALSIGLIAGMVTGPDQKTQEIFSAVCL